MKIKPIKSWTVVPNTWLNDSNLSLKAKGLIAYLQSRPDDWDFTVAGLMAVCKEGRDAIQSAIQELKDAGYLKWEQGRSDEGTMRENIVELRETPITENPKTDFQQQINKEEQKKEVETLRGGGKSESVVVYLRVNPSGRAWKSQRVYSTQEEVDRLESMDPDEYIDFKHWKSPNWVGDDSKAKFKRMKAKLVQPDVEEDEEEEKVNLWQ